MNSPVVLFDGECGLCNKAVAQLLRRDAHGVFSIAGGGGPVGQQLIKEAGGDPNVAATSIVVIDDGQIYTESDAVFQILSQLPFPWTLLSVGRILPRSVRNLVYEIIAKHRKKLTKGDIACGVPPEELRERWDERLVTEENLDTRKVQRFEFQFDAAYRIPLLLIFGVSRQRTYLNLTEDGLEARFSHIWLETPFTNIDCLHKTGPYRWWTAPGFRKSNVDNGVTFGTSRAHGVCICFKEDVRTGWLGSHEALTVTVSDPDALIAALEIAKP